MNSIRAFGEKATIRRKHSGFTIVELLVATGITVVMAGIMITVTTGMLSAWNRSRSGMVLRNQVKFVQDQLTADLEGALFRSDGNAWMVATVQPDQNFNSAGGALRGDVGGTSLPFWSATRLKPGWLDAGGDDSSLNLDPDSSRFEDFRFGMAGVWLRFFTIPPDNYSASGSDVDVSDLSAVRAVAYQIVRARLTESSRSPVRYCLLRSEVRPFDNGSPSTFSTGYDLGAAAYNNGSTTTDEAHPGRIRRPYRSQILAENVIDFGIRFFGKSTDGTTWSFPSANNHLSFVVSTNGSTLPAGSSHDYSGETFVGFPTQAEILVRVLSEEGAELLERFENGSGTFEAGTTWWELALHHSRVLTWRVQLRASAPGTGI